MGCLALVPLAQAQEATVTVGLTASSNSETSLAISPSSVDAGTPVTFKADVQPTQGGPNATGTVSFFYDGYLLGTAPVVGTVATLNFSSSNIPAGTYGIKAYYGGNTKYQPSTSSAAYFTVVCSTNSQTSLSASPGSVEPGNPITLTADVQPKQGGPSATGTVLFFIDNNYVGSATIKNTVAILSVPTGGAAKGKYSINAIYLGAGPYLASASNTAYVTVE
jgi:hypothetical protein